MSRTDKDRPYWVRTNDPNSLREEHHYHTLFGKAQYAWGFVKDENGELVYEDIFETRIIRTSTGEFLPYWYDYGRNTKNSSSDLFSLYNSQGILKFGYREKTVFIRRQKKRELLIKFVYPNHCTINEENVGGHYWDNQLTCYRSLTVLNHRSLKKDFRRQLHHSERRRTRDLLHKITLEANFFEDFDDSYVPVESRQHVGWWD